MKQKYTIIRKFKSGRFVIVTAPPFDSKARAHMWKNNFPMTRNDASYKVVPFNRLLLMKVAINNFYFPKED